MKLNKKGLIIVISGPSGVGKGEIKKTLLKRGNGNFVYSISATTRSPRPQEKNGKDYFFIKEEEFKKKIKENFFLEYNKFVNHYYGTPYKNVLKQLEEHKEVILEIDIEGALQIMQHKVHKDSVFIFIAPPSKKVLYERLKKRNSESPEDIKQRMLKSEKEIHLAYRYDYIVVNDEIDNAVDKIFSIIIAEHSKTKNSIDYYLTEILKKGEFY
ncbi:MAG: guanylate kinase [Candidatus Phytoplasma stylosanthis]|uniref:guanylate kinase n=1 Tax=Candidatus Phytoplasma stylosanthis TaxID=2798314 RepID=UPI00293A8A98|nr:guanylate kinase [Candidatus Phytoplasma stylosanthis]MDV3167834.1 guanylate kinase [Candidatus Phytoplasma stylosanthis]MDV3170890.1 guanylate kinase [Candidatus Phytoplasma stylosanthis]MDV3173702.1 guanylate kinase [Candidatus Phytoplasma stylosanthis]MDV3174070.1 guanylate kinase [Candidatus Phytoplasma stylosanthis]MDV3202418.1 guanylate kinase [Candidatus Phytoplasma stylosanthis]